LPFCRRLQWHVHLCSSSLSLSLWIPSKTAPTNLCPPFGTVLLQGITVEEKARRYGLSHVLDTPVDTVDKDLVVQYEVALQEGLDCGGAYLKFLTANDDLSSKSLSEKSGYSVMFGPDKCGTTNKVHLILRHQNPVSKKWEEKHLKKEVSIKSDSNAHLYTAVLRRDKTFEIYIDSESVANGKITEEMNAFVDGAVKDYNFVPPKEIDDPTDSKPDDWVDEAKIKDPEASKPDDWDEDAPKEILDMDTEMPEGWLVDAPEFVADPSAEMPEDWDEEEDGEWEAPQIKNPACTAAPGCGEWKRPMIPNPDYKGKWEHPMIDNPDYIGEWKAKQIPNPEYFSEETHPEAFHTLVAPIGGVAIEIWTMSSGIHFDNIYIGNDIIAAQEWAEASYGTKDAHEKKLLKAEAAKKRHEERAKRLEEGGFMNVLGYYFGEVGDVLADNLIATVITAALGMMAMIYWCCIAGEAAESDAYLPEEEDEDLDEVPDDEKDKAEEAAQPKAEDVAPKKEDTKAAEGDVNPESAAGSPKKKKKKKKAPKA
jgi:calnexin